MGISIVNHFAIIGAAGLTAAATGTMSTPTPNHTVKKSPFRSGGKFRLSKVVSEVAGKLRCCGCGRRYAAIPLLGLVMQLRGLAWARKWRLNDEVWLM